MRARTLAFVLITASWTWGCSALVDFTPPEEEPDAGEPDAGPGEDSGPPEMDAGPMTDGGALDDAGPPADAPPDAGPVDTGPPMTECGAACICRNGETCDFACASGDCTVDCRTSPGDEACCVACEGSPCCASDRSARVDVMCSTADGCMTP